jgi:hypothetical protein
MDDTRIVSGFGKAVAAQEYVLVDDQGRTLAVLSATQGKPALAFYNGKGEIRAWFTLTAEERRTFGSLMTRGRRLGGWVIAVR